MPRPARRMAAVAAFYIFAAPAGAAEIGRDVTDALDRGETPAVIVAFDGKADLEPAYAITDGDARAAWVYHALAGQADRAQAQARQTLASRFRLAERDRDYVVLWIDNSLAITQLTAPMLDALAKTPGVASVRLQQVVASPEVPATPTDAWSTRTNALFAIETNLDHIHVPEVWALGYRGAGVVVANIDTGVRHTHAALVRSYRGYRPDGTFDHVYNWYDPYRRIAEPRTSGPHGSHTMGTLVGDDGAGNAIGVAPEAKWIHCIGLGSGNTAFGTDAGLIECGQWVLAPYPPSGERTPDPTKRAHVVNNSWLSCGSEYRSFYENVINAWTAAGIAPVFCNGNAPNCGYPTPPRLNTVSNPARSGKVLSVGSTGKDDGIYATHSNLGPTDNANPGLPAYPDHGGFPRLKPNLAAPGVDIRSAGSASDDDYFSTYGTSMSAPHVAGTIALMWSAAPCLKSNYPVTGTLLMATATPRPRLTYSIHDGPSNVPNQATGWGEVDALAAVNAALAYCAAGAMPPEVSAAFVTPAMRTGGTSRLVVTLRNRNAVDATLGSAFAATLPGGLLVADATAATSCANGSVAAANKTFSLAAGARIPANGSCTVDVPVTATEAGIYAQTLAAGSLATDRGSNVMPASATLTVSDAPLRCSARMERSLAATGLAIDWRSGFVGDTIDPGQPFDLSLRDEGGLSVFWSQDPRSAFVASNASGADFLPLAPGTVVGPGSTWSHTNGLMPTFADGYLGLRFPCDAGACYGYAHLRTTAPTGYPATLVDFCYDPDGAPVTVAESTGVENVVGFAARFIPETVEVRQPAVLELTLTLDREFVGDGAFYGPTIQLTLPGGLQNRSSPSPSTTCGPVHQVGAFGGSTLIQISPWGGIPSTTRTCTMRIHVEGTAAGDYTMPFPAGTFPTNAGLSPATSARIAVTPFLPSARMAVTPTAFDVRVEAGLPSAPLPFSIANPGGRTLDWRVSPSCPSEGIVLAPASGLVPGGGRQDVAAMLDASDRAPGAYSLRTCLFGRDWHPLSGMSVDLRFNLTVDPVTVADGPCSAADTLFCDDFERLDSFTDRDAFLAALAPGHAENTFDAVPDGAPAVLTFLDNGFRYRLASSGQLAVAGGAVGVANASDVLLVPFNAAPVTAVGFRAGVVDASGAPVAGRVTVAFGNGKRRTVETAAGGSFAGFLTSLPINGITLAAPDAAQRPVVDDLVIGAAATAP